MEENIDLSAEEKWFEKLNVFCKYLEVHNKLPSPCSQSGRWLTYQKKAFSQNIDECKGLLQNPSIHKAFVSLRQEFPHLLMSEKEQWENSFLYKTIYDLVGF